MSYLFKCYAGFYDRFMKQFNLDCNEHMIEALGTVRGKKILDVGGGTGTLADVLQRQGACVTLVDPCAQMTKRARAKNTNLIIYTTTLEEMDEGVLKEQFDVVMIRDALHHMEKPEEVIPLVHKSLKPKGTLMIAEFNWSSPKTKALWVFETLCFENCRMFTPESLEQLCRPYFTHQKIQINRGFEMLYKGEKDEIHKTLV
ncbi:MAG: class I SAM-dependent methyltransferase [Niameybacter sp.]